MKIEIIPIKEDITEKEFPNYINKKGYNCIRFIKENFKEIRKIIKKDFKFDMVGKPDFFIYKKDRYYFCEFKSKSDSLHNSQLNWFFRNKNLPNAIAIVCSSMEPILVDDEVKEFLDNNKLVERESYNEVLKRLLKLNLKSMKGGQK